MRGSPRSGSDHAEDPAKRQRDDGPAAVGPRLCGGTRGGYAEHSHPRAVLRLPFAPQTAEISPRNPRPLAQGAAPEHIEGGQSQFGTPDVASNESMSLSLDCGDDAMA